MMTLLIVSLVVMTLFCILLLWLFGRELINMESRRRGDRLRLEEWLEKCERLAAEDLARLLHEYAGDRASNVERDLEQHDSAARMVEVYGYALANAAGELFTAPVVASAVKVALAEEVVRFRRLKASMNNAGMASD